VVVRILSIRLANQKDADRWNETVEKESLSTFCDRFEWCMGLHIISENIKPMPIIIEKNGEIVGTFPLCLRKYRFARCLESLPFSDYGGGIFFRSKDNGLFKQLIHRLVEIGTQNNCFRLTIRRAFFDDFIEANLVDKPVIVEAENCTFVISLEDDIDKIFRRIKKSRRKSIRRAIEKGVIVREADSVDDLVSYYRVYVSDMQSLRIPPPSFQFFKHIWDVFKPRDEVKIFLAEHNHKVIAGVSRFIYKQTIYSWSGVFLREYRMHACIWQ
jgi:CelD/BcsL family acetyltransferase involved in cellulose biosynthesis